MLKATSLLVPLVLCLSTTSMKCVSDGAQSSEGGGELEISHGDSTIGLGIYWRTTGSGTSRKLTVVNPSTATLEGCIVFEDAQGNTVSTVPAQMPPGSELTISYPPTAVRHRVANGDDCPDVGAPSAPTGNAPGAGRRTRRFHIDAAQAVDLDDPNRDNWAFGYSSDAAAWTQTAVDLARNGFQSDFALQPGVTGVMACQLEASVQPGNDIKITLASNRAFETLELLLNDTPVASMSQGQRPAVLGKGWDAYSFVLPSYLPEINYSSVSGETWINEIELRFKRKNDPSAYSLRRKVGFTSN